MMPPAPTTAADPLRLAFMGTPDFAVPALAALLEAGHEIVAVYTQPPRPAGRGMSLKPSPVQIAAEAAGVPVFCPVSLKDPAAQDAFAAHDLDAAVVAAYGLILPKPVLAAPRLGCWNIHASLLPRWRGAAPIERAILAGDEETGVCIMRMEAGLDTGPVLRRAVVAIGPETTGGALHDALAALGAAEIVPAMAEIAAGNICPEPQAKDGVTYAAKIDKAELRLDWRRPAVMLERQVRAFAPSPGVWFALPQETGAAERVRVLRAVIEPLPGGADEPRPGNLISPIAVGCGGGSVLRLLAIQRAGRSPVEGAAMLNGWRLPPGTMLPLPDGADAE